MDITTGTTATTTASYNLFLDDIRYPDMAYPYTQRLDYLLLKWQTVRSYDEFVRHIKKNGLPELVSFDHDLADEHYDDSMYRGEEYNKNYETFKEKTGYECVKWLVDHCIETGLPFPKWYLHTMNPIGKENMKGYILSYLKHSAQNTENT